MQKHLFERLAINIDIYGISSSVDHFYHELRKSNPTITREQIIELFAEMAGLPDSCSLNHAISSHRESNPEQYLYDGNGNHKKIPAIVKKSGENPIALYDFLTNSNRFENIIFFFDDFEVTGGHKYKRNDCIFCNDVDVAAKEVLKWEHLANPVFTYWPEEDVDEFGYESEGVWEICFPKTGDERYLGGCGILDTSGLKSVNTPSMPEQHIKELLFRELMRDGELGELPFHVYNRDAFEHRLLEKIEDYYIWSHPGLSSSSRYYHSKLFSNYLDENTINKLDLEIGRQGPLINFDND